MQKSTMTHKKPTAQGCRSSISHLTFEKSIKTSKQSQKFWFDRMPGWAQIMLLVMLVAGACITHP